MMKFLFSTTIAVVCFVAILLASVAYFFVTTPRPDDIRNCLTAKMNEVRLCPKEPGYVRLRDVSPHAKNAIIVSEDAAFYAHEGFDWTELEKSLEQNIQKGKWARGGSTITQQLAKNVYLSSEKSLLRKFREALIAVQLEKNLSKDEILEKYLNVVEFGKDLYGIGKASKHYFGKAPSALSPAEGAFLAFLLPNPKSYEVSFRKKKLTPFARQQTREIVNRLYRFKRISEEERDLALVRVDYLFGGEPPLLPENASEPGAEERLVNESGETVDTSMDETAPAEQTIEPSPEELVEQND